MTTELACLKYTKEDWIRVYHENLLWAQEKLAEAKEMMAKTDDAEHWEEHKQHFYDACAWTRYISIHNKWLKENDPNHPWSLSQYIKALAYQVVQAQRQMLHLEHKVNELSQRKRGPRTISDKRGKPYRGIKVGT